MKKIFPSLILSVLLLTCIGATIPLSSSHVAHAQTKDPCPYGRAEGKVGDAGGCNPPPSADCMSLTSGVNVESCILAIPGVIAAYIVLPLVGWLTTLSGLLLNFTVNFTVVHMAEKYTSVPAIDQVWGTMRDIANMLFIFILLYEAILTMFGKGHYQQTIRNIVIAAVLINFSLFFTKVIIDAGNLLALTVYHAIVAAPDNGNWSNALDTGVSNALMNQLHMASIWKTAGLLNGRALITIGVMGSIVALIAAFIFLAAAVMLIIRFISLILVLVLSPIMVVSSIIPGIGTYSKQWWGTLWGQTFFAPVLFLMLWVSIKLSQSMYAVIVPSDTNPDLGAALTGTFDASGHFTGTAGSFGILLNYALLIGFLIASLAIAKSISGKSASLVNSATKWATGFAGGATLGMAGRFSRGTVGRAGQAVADSEYLKSKAPTSRLARLSLAAGRKTSEASFDARNTIAGKTLGAGQGQGKGKGGGFAADLKAKVKRETEFAKSLGPSDLVKAQAETRVIAAQTNLDTARQAAEREVDAEFKKPPALTKLEADRDTARRMADNTTMSEAGRARARQRAEQLSAQAERINIDYQRRREERITQKVAPHTEAVKQATTDNEDAKEAGKKRANAYATSLEEQKTFGREFDVTGRILGVFGVKKENLAAAAAIRKSMKDKSSAEKITEEIERQVKEAGKKEAEEETNPAENTAPTGGDTGGTPPAPPTA